MFTLQRFQAADALLERGVARVRCLGLGLRRHPHRTRTAAVRQLQAGRPASPPSSTSPELIADVPLLRGRGAERRSPRLSDSCPASRGGQRQIITRRASPAFKAYQRHPRASGSRRSRPAPAEPQKGDDILLSVITDGRHAAIDLRLVWPDNDNEPDEQAQRADRQRPPHLAGNGRPDTIYRPDGTPYPIPGAGQMIFSDLGTIKRRGRRAASRPIAGSGPN